MPNTTCRTKEFRFNGRFKTLSGAKYIKDGDIMFPDDPENLKLFNEGLFSREYWTHFGPRCLHGGTIYDCDNEGLRGAVRRLTCVREPGKPGLHGRLMANQEVYCRTSSPKNWLVEFRRTFHQLLLDVPFSNEGMRDLWTDQPHPKRELRRKVRKDIVVDGRTGGRRFDYVDYKCKPQEVLKQNKYLRAVGDLTAPGSTVGCYLMDHVKSAFGKGYHFKNGFCTYIKPSRETMLECFSNLIDLKYDVYFNYFSDDSNCAIRCSDGVLRCNCDISACDGSNFAPVFKLLEQAMSVDSRFVADIRTMFKQLEAPCKIVSTQSKRGVQGMKVKLEPVGPVLYSGSALTTAVNNMANTLIFLSIMDGYRKDMTKREAIQLIEESAERCGYILKCEVCDEIQKIQFLKYSPTRNGGMYLNLGVILRTFGMCKGDLEGKKNVSILERGIKRSADVVASHVHAGDSRLMRVLRSRYPNGNVSKLEIEIHKQWRLEKQVEDIVLDEDVCLRYSLSQEEYLEVCEIYATCPTCCIINSEAVRKIILCDYGY